jgi:hypothetical protein
LHFNVVGKSTDGLIPPTKRYTPFPCFATLARMNPKYLWLTDALQLLTFFIVGPVLAIAIGYGAWRRTPQNFDLKRHGIVCVASGIAAFLLFGFAKWMNADVRTAQYFLQLACVLLSGLLFGVYMGYGFCVLVGLLRWHNKTRLTRDDETQR